MVSCQKGPTRHANAWQIGPLWQDTLDMLTSDLLHNLTESHTILQHTTELSTTLQLGGVLARLSASPIRVTLYTHLPTQTAI